MGKHIPMIPNHQVRQLRIVGCATPSADAANAIKLKLLFVPVQYHSLSCDSYVVVHEFSFIVTLGPGETASKRTRVIILIEDKPNPIL